MSEDTMFNQAIEAARQGERARARDLLTRLLRVNQKNPQYWLWMSSLVDSPKEQIYCLRSVLRLEPDNIAAKRGLVLLGAEPPDESITPVPPARRGKWKVPELSSPALTGLAAVVANPVVRIIALTTIGLVVIVLAISAFRELSARQKKQALADLIKLTLTSIPSPTLTVAPTLTHTPRIRTPTPTFAKPTPLALLLDATYTPTPLYPSTPHPSTEAYRTALRALERQDWDRAINLLNQVIDIEPTAADVHYLIGEALRFQGDHRGALQSYQRAIEANSTFAPAYMARARTNRILDPEADVLDDLDEAIAWDPNFAEAYLERAQYHLDLGELETALGDLARAEQLLPESPLVYLFFAQAYLKQGAAREALLAARRSHELDITLLPTYLALGQAHQSLGNGRPAIDHLNTYLVYEDEDPVGWYTLGLAFRTVRDFKKAISAFDEAIGLDQSPAEIYQTRGLTYLEMGESEKAIEDLTEATRRRPKSFRFNIALGKTLFMLGRPGDAYIQLNRTAPLVQDDNELAELYFWRAQSLEALDEPTAAVSDWEALLALPEDATPAEWVTFALDHLLALTPTTPPPTPTDTLTPSPTSTRTPSPTQTPSPSPTQGGLTTPTPTTLS